MAVDPKLTSIVTNIDDQAELPSVGVTCIVGSNNVGKSQLLRDIVSLLEQRNAKQVVIKQVSLSRGKPSPSLEEVTDWLDKTAQRQAQSSQDTYSSIGSGGSNLTARQFFDQLNQGENYLGPTRSFYIWHADAGSRVGLGGGSIGSPNMGPNAHPLARLYREGELEQRLSDLSKSTFGFALTLDRVNGNVRLMVGETGLPIPPLNRPTKEYSDAVAALPTLESQGDGVKSFIGLALYAMAGYQPMVLIDEPEAFLHQAQAKALGRWIATESKSRSQQVVVATHSRDIILGLLAGGSDVTILRLSRVRDESHLKQLAVADVANVWADPILRYSNVLDGLFFQSVVICEADADCRFYGAVLDDLSESGKSNVNPDDVLFVASGGKDRVPSIAKALSALGVKTFCIVDFDVLHDRSKCKQIIESLGGDWTLLNSDYVAVANALNGTQDGWDQVKSAGLAAVPVGAASQAADRLLKYMAEVGCLVVPVGELEGFDRTITGKSSVWVNAMLAKRGHESSTAAKRLVATITNSVVGPGT